MQDAAIETWSIKDQYNLPGERARSRSPGLFDKLFGVYTIGAHVKLKTECSKPNVKIHSLGARRGHRNVEYQRPIQSARRARARALSLLIW